MSKKLAAVKKPAKPKKPKAPKKVKDPAAGSPTITEGDPIADPFEISADPEVNADIKEDFKKLLKHIDSSVEHEATKSLLKDLVNNHIKTMVEDSPKSPISKAHIKHNANVLQTAVNVFNELIKNV